MCLQAAPALAESYEVNLTRRGSNVYKIDGKDKCEVKAIFGTSKQKPRRCSVTVSRQDNNWFIEGDK